MKPPATATADQPSESGLRIGIDVGGTWIKGAIINLSSGTPISAVRHLPTPSGGAARAVANVLNQLLDELGSEMPGRTLGAVGVAIPSIVQHGVARSAANMDASWIGLDVEAYLTERLRLPVSVVNDADAAGLAEARYGAGKDTHGVVLVLTLGTGIGSALIVDGKLIPNFELGHLHIDGYKAESRASAVAREKEGLNWMEYAHRLQRYLSHVEFLLSPDLIIIGGGISACSDEYLPCLSLRTPVIPALLENSAGVVGAALQIETTHRLPALSSRA
jgi:polyphosphate glucokinase